MPAAKVWRGVGLIILGIWIERALNANDAFASGRYV